ncbi:MAG: hypothetical protein RBQ81_00425 [Arcobacteraceae bacterium]|nr:hypothetical protein [Arcobacteraceae bacterium]MDY0364302.1 hypothetical protein [Arcobacteraceae bacterium]
MYKYLFLLFYAMFIVGCSTTKQDSIKTHPYPSAISKENKDIQKGILEKKSEKLKENDIFSIEKGEFIKTEESVLGYSGKKEKIAIIFASKVVGKYGSDTINSVVSYLMQKNIDFDLRVYDSIYENQNSVQKSFDEASQEGFKNIIAVLAYEQSLSYISNLNFFDNIYIPTLHKKNSFVHSNNIIYGAISYEEQYDKLFRFANSYKLVEIYDTDKISNLFLNYISLKGKKLNKRYQIVKSQTNFKSLFQNNSLLNDSTIFLNSTVLQSAIVMSQLRVYEIYPDSILATQLSYNPMILTLSQYQDRKKMFIASSIGDSTSNLVAIGSVLGADIRYNWVNFSTLIGLNKIIFNNQDSEISGYKIIDNQVIYNISLYRAGEFSFIKID